MVTLSEFSGVMLKNILISIIENLALFLSFSYTILPHPSLDAAGCCVTLVAGGAGITIASCCKLIGASGGRDCIESIVSCFIKEDLSVVVGH